MKSFQYACFPAMACFWTVSAVAQTELNFSNSAIPINATVQATTGSGRSVVRFSDPSAGVEFLVQLASFSGNVVVGNGAATPFSRVDSIFGSTGADTVTLSPAGGRIRLMNVERVIGRQGNDEVLFRGNINNANVDLGAGNDGIDIQDVATVSLTNVERVLASELTPNQLTLRNTVTNNMLINLQGNILNIGPDVLNLAAGTNQLAAAGVSNINGTASDDRLTIAFPNIQGRAVEPTIDMGSGVDFLIFLSTPPTGVSTLNAEAITGSNFNDTIRLTGNNGANVLGAGGNDSLFGSLGTDQAFYSGPRGDYVITRVNVNTVTIRDNNTANGNEGTDTLQNFEQANFAGTVVGIR